MEINMRSFVSTAVVSLLLASPVLAGNTNLSQIDQIGDALAAETIQEGTQNSNTADIEQGLSSTSDNLTAFITQTGGNNINEATIKQDGSDNYSDILQEGDFNTSHAEAVQTGVNNENFITQSGTDNTNDATITQNGTGALNSAVITQGGTSNTNTAGISQNGSGLVAATTQN
jgi:trimeric autotransporter adhesin